MGTVLVLGGFAAQAIHLEGDFEVAHGQFHLPAAQIEFGERMYGVRVAIEQGGDEDVEMEVSAGLAGGAGGVGGLGPFLAGLPPLAAVSRPGLSRCKSFI